MRIFNDQTLKRLKAMQQKKSHCETPGDALAEKQNILTSLLVVRQPWQSDSARKARRLYSYLRAVYYAKPYNQLPHTAEHQCRVSAEVCRFSSLSSCCLLLSIFFCHLYLLSISVSHFSSIYDHHKTKVQTCPVIIFLNLFTILFSS